MAAEIHGRQIQDDGFLRACMSRLLSARVDCGHLGGDGSTRVNSRGAVG